MLSSLLIPRQIADSVIAHAQADAPNECCGFLAGKNGEIIHWFPLSNAAKSPTTRFESSPESTFATTKEMRRLGVEILAVYHSHPTSIAAPSSTDREWNYSADVVNVIVSLIVQPPQLRAWQIDGEVVAEIEVCIS
jgi:[CysO sulfur-carrier protein]-S-L-cysteine hydrolase